MATNSSTNSCRSSNSNFSRAPQRSDSMSTLGEDDPAHVAALGDADASSSHPVASVPPATGTHVNPWFGHNSTCQSPTPSRSSSGHEGWNLNMDPAGHTPRSSSPSALPARGLSGPRGQPIRANRTRLYEFRPVVVLDRVRSRSDDSGCFAYEEDIQPPPIETIAGAHYECAEEINNGSGSASEGPSAPPSLEGGLLDHTDDGDDASTDQESAWNRTSVEGITDLILNRSYNLRLQDMDSRQDAFRTVSYCLDELSHLADADSESEPMDQEPTDAPDHGSSGQPSSSAPRDGSGGMSGGSNGPPRQNAGNAPSRSDGGGDNGPSRNRKRSREPDDRQPDLPAQPELSCPFRKHNPAKFNVRHYPSCVQPFPNISQVKRHVKNFHLPGGVRLKHTCPICNKILATKEDLKSHVQAKPQCTEPSDQEKARRRSDPEAGITVDVLEALNDRKRNNKISNWADLWSLLFPSDPAIPDSDYIPPVELAEIRQSLESSTAELYGELYRHFATILSAPDLNIGGSQYDLVMNMTNACRIHTSKVLSRLQSSVCREGRATKRRRAGLEARDETVSDSLVAESAHMPPTPAIATQAGESSLLWSTSLFDGDDVASAAPGGSMDCQVVYPNMYAQQSLSPSYSPDATNKTPILDQLATMEPYPSQLPLRGPSGHEYVISEDAEGLFPNFSFGSAFSPNIGRDEPNL